MTAPDGTDPGEGDLQARDAWRPPYAFVPGGPWPHPRSDPAGHSFGRVEGPEPPAQDDDDRRSPRFVLGVLRFNAGYYWEAHEDWEALWHAHGRAGPTADVLRALIKLAAAGVKVREGRPAGVQTHARRAAELLEKVAAGGSKRRLGLDLDALAATARALAADPPHDPGPRDARVFRALAFTLTPWGDEEQGEAGPES
jgi:predicted metal-dependent hydrolase